MQAFQAAIYASNIPQLVVAKIDIARFTALNTAKGSWALLNLLSSVKISADIVGVTDAPATRLSSISIKDVQSIIRQVAAGIIGEELGGNDFL